MARDLSKAERFAAAGVSGVTATLCVHPLDVLRVRLQIDGEGKSVLRGPVHCASVVYKEGGITGLYAGLSAGIARQATLTPNPTTLAHPNPNPHPDPWTLTLTLAL